MVFAKTAGVSATLALAGLLQICPAPIPIIAAVVSGVVGGGVSAGIGICATKCHRSVSAIGDRSLPPGVNQHDIDLCTQQINDQKTGSGGIVDVYNTTETTVRADNVPPACMTLATILTGVPAQDGGPVPIPMGSASLEYHGMTADDMIQLQSTLVG